MLYDLKDAFNTFYCADTWFFVTINMKTRKMLVNLYDHLSSLSNIFEHPKSLNTLGQVRKLIISMSKIIRTAAHIIIEMTLIFELFMKYRENVRFVKFIRVCQQSF